MEDVLEAYHRPHDPAPPLVCVDESSKQLIKETRTPIPMKRGQPARYDCEYERNGTANLFMMFASLEGWRHVKVTERRAYVDYAQILKELSDSHFPNAEKITLVQDNLSTHTAAALYEAFPPKKRVVWLSGSKWQYTPKHGSWLNLAESELGPPSALMDGCQTEASSRARSPLGRRTGIRNTPRPIGALPSQMLVSDLSLYTLHFE
jgi:DDE superfamily endonuclease